MSTSDQDFPLQELLRRIDKLVDRVETVQDLSVKLATLVDVIRSDVEKLEDYGADKDDLAVMCARMDHISNKLTKHMDAAGSAFSDVREHTDTCTALAETRMQALLNQRLADLGLDSIGNTLLKVERHDEFIDTFKKVAVKNGLYGGGVILAAGSALIYIARGIFTGDWNPFN